MMLNVSRTQGYHNDVRDFMCDASDADKPVVGAVTTLPNGSTCLNTDEAIEYIAFRGVWKLYVTLG